MIGFYDYTVILTYLSVLSAGAGIMVSLTGAGHPYWGVMFLMICGLCDTFDGRVARSKKNRTKKEKDFGVQIDSLSDLVAFGVLPTCIGIALYKRDMFMGKSSILAHIPYGVIILIGALFILCALIRLAYFNITVEETQSDSLGDEKYYFGLPVTSTALIFPTFLLIRHVFCFNLSFVYYILLIIVGILFITKFKLRKPNSKEIYLMVLLGAIEFVLILIIKLFVKH
jgi:CDP-diacylglycerol--serine O-phosphatidyltransferase